MYWVNMVQPPTINRASMDGTERMILFSKALGKPGPLAVDVHNEKLYWADGNLHRIECSDLDCPSFSRIFISSGNKHMFFINPIQIFSKNSHSLWTSNLAIY
jgi:low density lipoprotein receptor-related protein 5/6